MIFSVVVSNGRTAVAPDAPTRRAREEPREGGLLAPRCTATGEGGGACEVDPVDRIASRSVRDRGGPVLPPPDAQPPRASACDRVVSAFPRRGEELSTTPGSSTDLGRSLRSVTVRDSAFTAPPGGSRSGCDEVPAFECSATTGGGGMAARVRCG